MDNYFKLTVLQETYSISGNDTTCYLRVGLKSGKTTLITFSATGRAHCGEDDVFDEHKGKKIAQTKATQKVYDAADNWFIGVIENLANFQDAYHIFKFKYDYVTNRNEKYLEKC